MKNRDMVFCVINFNQEDKTILNLKNKLQFFSKINFTFYVHVIDNGSFKFPSKLKLFCKENDLQFDFLDSNYGIVNALNVSIKKFYNNIKIFVRDDNDIFYDLKEINSFNQMINYIISEKVSLCGPKVLDKLGNFQSGKIKISKFGFNSDRINFPEISSTDVILGCYMVINFQEISQNESLFSENIKFGSEELELSLRLKSIGKKVIYYPFFYINHHHGLTTQSSNKQSSFTNYLLIRNNEVVLSKYSPFYINFLRKIYFLIYHICRALIKKDTYYLKAYFSGLIKKSISEKEWKRLVK